MASTDQHSAFTFRNGQLTIEEGVISLDFDIWDAIRRHYQYHKVVVGTLCFFALFYAIAIPVAIIFDPGYVVLTREEGLTYLAMLLVPAALVVVQLQRRSHQTIETTIALEQVDYVHIRPASRFRSTCISIVYDDTSKVRKIFTNVRGFGEAQQYEQAKWVLEAQHFEVREG